MITWQIDMNRGVYFLSKHDARMAVRCFCQALQRCPVSNARELARLLFFLGTAFKRLGYSNYAIKSWNASQRLLKNGYARKALTRYSNAYGMERQESEDEDDWRAFYCIQLRRYLAGKGKRTFTSDAERDMIRDLVQSYWKDLKSSGALEGRSIEEKCRVFRSVDIVFPCFGITESCVHVNFSTGKRVELDERCYCGSGLPFLSCCGRIVSEEELSTGIF